MKKLIILAVSVFTLFTSCQQRPQVFGVYIDGTFEQFLKDLDKEPWKCPINIDTIQHLSESKISIKAYSTEVIDLNEDSVKVDSIYHQYHTNHRCNIHLMPAYLHEVAKWW